MDSGSVAERSDERQLSTTHEVETHLQFLPDMHPMQSAKTSASGSMGREQSMGTTAYELNFLPSNTTIEKQRSLQMSDADSRLRSTASCVDETMDAVAESLTAEALAAAEERAAVGRAAAWAEEVEVWRLGEQQASSSSAAAGVAEPPVREPEAGGGGDDDSFEPPHQVDAESREALGIWFVFGLAAARLKEVACCASTQRVNQSKASPY